MAFDHADRTSLVSALQRYAADLEAERFAEIDEAIPPGIYRMFVERSGETERAMRARMIELETRLLDGSDILDVVYDTTDVEIERSENGYDFTFVPTTTIISEGLGPDVTTDTQTFALQEDGIWHFLRLKSNSDFEVVQAAYPDFASIEPPR